MIDMYLDGLITILDDSISEDKMMNIFNKLVWMRKVAEEAEDYEYCAQLRDMEAQISNFILGYVERDKISWISYYTIIQHGSTIGVYEDDMNPGTYEAIYEMDGMYYRFNLSANQLEKIINQINGN